MASIFKGVSKEIDAVFIVGLEIIRFSFPVRWGFVPLGFEKLNKLAI